MSLPPKTQKTKRPVTPPAARAWFMIFVISLSVGFMIFVDFQRRLQHDPHVAPPAGRYWGDPDSEFKIIQFVDFQSLECARGLLAIKEYISKHPGDVFLQTHYYAQGEETILPALYAECAAKQKKFYDFMDRLYQRYPQWANFPNDAVFKDLAGEMGIDISQLAQCVEGKDAAAAILADHAYGESQFVRTTPTYFLNGHRAVGVEALKKILDQWHQENIGIP